MNRKERAFTLVEILTVAFVATMVVGLLVPPALSSFVTRQRIAKEDAILAQLKADIETSFESRDLDLFNLSAVPGEISSPATRPTAFSTTTAPVYSAITGTEWFAKIARARGYSVAAGLPVSRTSQPALHDIAFNDVDRPRLVFLDPNYQNDAARIRYMVISVVGRADELVLPPYQPTAAWFNAIWDTPWDRYDSTLPSIWTGSLTAQQVANWNSDTPGKTRLHRLRVVRITQRKHEVTVNANHPTDQVAITWNDGARDYLLQPDTGAWTSPQPVPAGRVVRISVGDPLFAMKVSEVTVRERLVFTAQ